MDIEQFRRIIYAEKVWCEDHKSDVSEEFYRGFVAGLEHALFLYEQSMTTPEECSLGYSVVEEPNEG